MLNCISVLHSVKKQVQLHFSCTAVSSKDSLATDLLMLQTQYKVVHVCTGTYMHTVYAMGVYVIQWFTILRLCMYVLARTCMQHRVRHIHTGTYMLLVRVFYPYPDKRCFFSCLQVETSSDLEFKVFLLLL